MVIPQITCNSERLTHGHQHQPLLKYMANCFQTVVSIWPHLYLRIIHLLSLPLLAVAEQSSCAFSDEPEKSHLLEASKRFAGGLWQDLGSNMRDVFSLLSFLLISSPFRKNIPDPPCSCSP